MKRGIFLIHLCFVAIISIAQNYSIALIPDSLLENSNQVVRCREYKVNVKNLSQANCVFKEAVTILNDFGRSALSFATTVSKYESLKSFRAIVYDKEGKPIRKFKKSDLKYSEISSHLASDIAHYFYSFPSYGYPCTVEVEYEKSLQDFVASYPTFVIFSNRGGESLQRASYEICLPQEMQINTLNVGCDLAHSVSSENGVNIQKWEVYGIKAVKADYYMPEMKQAMYVTPLKLEYNGKILGMSSWTEFGSWLNSLFEGRDVLSDELKNKVHELVNGISDDRTKVKRLYEYMTTNCRYVSIQIGIGGIQPMSAEDVYRTKFGDCKGLSFFLGAMLKEIGIKSNLVFISTENKRLNKDKISLVTTNHAILRVQLADEVLWLECTNPELPFGFIHNDIVGHDAIVIDGENTHIATLPQYPDSVNRSNQSVLIEINETGEAQFEMNFINEVGEYDYVDALATIDDDKRKSYLLKQISIPNIVINDIKVSKIEEQQPKIEMRVKASAYRYGNKTGARYFVPLNPFRKQFSKLDKTRLYDIDVKYGYVQNDTIKIKLPQNITAEVLPKKNIKEYDFGRIYSNVMMNGNVITIEQSVWLNSGVYSKREVEYFNEFFSTINNSYLSKIILKETK